MTTIREQAFRNGYYAGREGRAAEIASDLWNRAIVQATITRNNQAANALTSAYAMVTGQRTADVRASFWRAVEAKASA